MFNAAVFKQRSSIFERLLTWFIKPAARIMYRILVSDVTVVVHMKFLKESSQTFIFHSYALYATDVMFQQRNCPCENMLEAKPCFSGKHKLHGFKTEASDLLTGLCVPLSKQAKKGEVKISIFRRCMSMHKFLTLKTKREADIINEENEDALHH